MMSASLPVGMNRRRRDVALAALATGLGVFVLGSCNPSGREGAGEGLVGLDKPASHAVLSDDLRLAMRDVLSGSYEQIRAEVGMGDRPAPNMSRVEATAASLARSADRICDILTGVRMGDADRQAFVALAGRLRQEATDLSNEASRNDLEDARATMTKITATCNACHTAFRVLPAVPKESP